MKKFVIALSIALAAASASGRNPWTMEECMAYAAEHSADVEQARWDLASASADKDEALAAFFPSVSAQVGGQFNWGRNIDPETNTYNNVTTFNNGYGVYASLTLFDGGQTFNRYKQARVERKRSSSSVDMQRDDRAIATMMAYVDAVYYRGSVKIAEDKLAQSKGVLTLTQRQEELGIKGLPDVAEAKATVAGDEYNLVNHQNLYTQAMLRLRSHMNLPYEEQLELDSVAISDINALAGGDDAEVVYTMSLMSNPVAREAELGVKASEYAYKASKGLLFPTIGINAGIGPYQFLIPNPGILFIHKIHILSIHHMIFHRFRQAVRQCGRYMAAPKPRWIRILIINIQFHPQSFRLFQSRPPGLKPLFIQIGNPHPRPGMHKSPSKPMGF